MTRRLSTAVAMVSMTIEALAELVQCDVRLRRGDFSELGPWIRATWPRQPGAEAPDIAGTFLAVARAALWYPRVTLCLPRAAAATRLLRRRGVAAKMVIGVRHTPFAAHAWVEIDSVPVGPEAAESGLYTRLTQMG